MLTVRKIRRGWCPQVSDDPDKQIIRPKLPNFLRQKPIGHLLHGGRMVMILAPCCQRRMRIRLVFNGRGWDIPKVVRCCHCRHIWRVTMHLNAAGFATRVRFQAAL